jgi:hypothetical protein
VRTSWIQRDDDDVVHFVLVQHAWLDIYSANSVKTSQSFISFLNAACLEEKQQIPILCVHVVIKFSYVPCWHQIRFLLWFSSNYTRLYYLIKIKIKFSQCIKRKIPRMSAVFTYLFHLPWCPNKRIHWPIYQQQNDYRNVVVFEDTTHFISFVIIYARTRMSCVNKFSK